MPKIASPLLLAALLLAPTAPRAQAGPAPGEPPKPADAPTKPQADAPPPAPGPSATAGAAPAAATEAKPPPWYALVTVGGLVDGYYAVRLDAAQAAPVGARVFDASTGFNLGYAKLSAALAPGEKAPAGFRLDLGFGPAADAITSPSAPARFVQQAYGAMLLGPVELDLGRFATSAGAEVIESKDDWIYSRSLLFGLIPFTHVGARAVLPVGAQPGLTLTLGVNNGWDVVTGSQPGKTGQLSLAWAGPSATTAALNLYSGVNPTTYGGTPNTRWYRTLVDVVLGATAGPLDVNLNLDWSTEAADTWYGASLMGRYHLPADVLRVSLRGELVKDLHGVRFGTGKDTTAAEGTLSFGYPVGTTAELRLEGRYDHASEEVFVKATGEGAGAGVRSKSQVTALLAAIAWF